VVVAPQNFKGTANAVEVAGAIAKGVRSVWPSATCVELPVADGGEGTVRALVHATGGTFQRTRTTDPLGREIEAAWGMLGDGTTAVVEMAAASGLTRLRESERDPLRTSTRGTGDLLLAAARRARRVITGIGDSATNDGGSGMARAFGIRFLDADGNELPEGGAALARLQRIEGNVDAALRGVTFEVACDVRNPLLGPDGASAVFGPQKGASPAEVALLDRALARYADVVESRLGRSVRDVPGAGAAGGLGAGLVAFLEACLRPGAALVLELVRFDRALEGADLVISGEGRLDHKSWFGKLTHTVTRTAREHGVPTGLVVGSVEGEARERVRADVVGVRVSSEVPGAESMPAVASIERAAADLVRTVQAPRWLASVGPLLECGGGP